MKKRFRARTPVIAEGIQFDDTEECQVALGEFVGEAVGKARDGDGVWWLTLQGTPRKIHAGDWVVRRTTEHGPGLFMILTDRHVQDVFEELS